MKRKCLAIGIILLFTIMNFTPVSFGDSTELFFDIKHTDAGDNIISGKIIYVDIHNTEGPWNGTLEHPFQHIHDAVNIVCTGDTIYVFHGQYNESFDFDFNEQISFNLTGEDKYTTFLNGVITIYYCPLTIIITNFTLNSVRLWISAGYYNTIKNCRIGSGGIFLDGSYYNQIINNIFMNSSLLILGGRYNTIIGNTFTSKGIVKVEPTYDYMWGWNTHIIENNTINGKPIRYYVNKKNITVPDDTGQLYLVNCSNFLIKNLTISNVEIGITAYYSPYNTICNCSITNASSSGGYYYAQTGIALHHSNYNIIQDTLIDNFAYGIECDVSSGTNITNCIIQNHYYGIILYALYTFISRSIIRNNKIAIWITLGSSNVIEFSTISQNNRSIDLDECSKTIIQNNNIFDNIQEPYFYNSFFTKWRKNYWGRLYFGPKIIHGRIDYYSPFYFLPGIHTKWIQFDWHPARKPYDIP